MKQKQKTVYFMKKFSEFNYNLKFLHFIVHSYVFQGIYTSFKNVKFLK